MGTWRTTLALASALAIAAPQGCNGDDQPPGGSTGGSAGTHAAGTAGTEHAGRSGSGSGGLAGAAGEAGMPGGHAGERGGRGHGGSAGAGRAGAGYGGGSSARGGTAGAHEGEGGAGEGGVAGEGGEAGTTSGTGGEPTGGIGGGSGIGGSVGATGGTSNGGTAGGGDACASVTCSGHGTCTSSGGLPTCSCDLGYAQNPGDATACVDVNECAQNNGGCDPLTACTNSDGSRTCSGCPQGYSGTGETACVPNVCSGAPDASCACLKVMVGGDDALGATSGGVLPFANVQPALDFAATHSNAPLAVCVAEGASCGEQAIYPGPVAADLSMRDGVSLYGDYESSTWSRCAQPGTTLAPDSGKGVYFGPTIASNTVLDGFSIARFTDTESAGITLDGARAVVVSDIEMNTPAPGATTTYGIDARNDADATLSGIVMSPDFDDPDAAAPHQFGIRALGAKVVLKDSTLELHTTSPAEDVVGAWFQNAAGSAVLDSTITVYSSVSTTGIHAEDTATLTLDGTSLLIRNGLAGSPDVNAAADFVSAPGLSWQAGTVVGYQDSDEPPFTRVISLVDSPGAQLNVDVTSGSGCTDGVYLAGDAEDTVLDGSVGGLGQMTRAGVTVDDCAGKSPLIRTAVDVRGSATGGDGINVSGDCAPTIAASASVRFHAGGALGGTTQTLTGIHCHAPARCIIDHASGGVTGGATQFNSKFTAFGIACDDGACPTIVDSIGTGLSAVNERRIARYMGGGISAPGAILIARNEARGLCTGGDGVGLLGSGRIENNVIVGPNCGQTYLDGLPPYGVSNAVGLKVSGSAVVHSNSIAGGLAHDCEPPICNNFVGRSTGVFASSVALLLNNIVTTNTSVGNTAIFLKSMDATAGNLLHDDLTATTLVAFGTTDYVPYSSIGTVTGVNGLIGASGNFSGGSVIDAGTTLDAPATDKNLVSRDESPDVGPYEATGAPSPCFGFSCSDHGVCQFSGSSGACTCDPGYAGTHCENSTD